ncbi:anti-sigma factor [Neobacillus mesonae]|uniref:anti-sigma factor n=1 Tax=Neobacillus mesonae TaxID=1193713 RepID=UPI00082ED767|nr:anti-sigma factor [Neobacillus mesonae]
MENKCENLSLYIIDELSEHERAQFEHHLKTCIHCQKEIHSLKETWEMLSFDFEEKDVPASLKDEVMDFIFQEQEAEAVVKTCDEEPKRHDIKLFFAKQFSPLSAGIAAVLLIGAIGLLWSNLQLRNNIAALENKVGSTTTTEIVRTFHLSGQNTALSANGNAYLVKEGSSTVLVIELNNMPDTKNEEVYQVWLLKNGKRQSAGTLKPDSSGNGLITYRLPKNHSFDDIGITLEPNPNNTQPQGQKVMGTT